MDTRREQALRDLLQSYLPQSVRPVAADQAAEPAQACCRECRRFFTWRGLQPATDDFQLICRTCEEERQQTVRRRRPLAILKHPALYVVLIVLLAVGLWLGGAGRTDWAAIRQADQGRVWYEQKYADRLLRRAREVKDRVDALNARGDAELLPRWSHLAEDSFRELAELWKDTPAHPDLLVGAALMRAVRGDAKAAYEELAALGQAYGEKDPAFVPYHFYCGRVALQDGRKDAGKLHLENVLRVLHLQQKDLVETVSQLLDVDHVFSNDAEAFRARRRALQAVDLELTTELMTETSLRLLKEYQIPSAIAARIETDRGRAASMPESQPAGDLIIEDLEKSLKIRENRHADPD